MLVVGVDSDVTALETFVLVIAETIAETIAEIVITFLIRRSGTGKPWPEPPLIRRRLALWMTQINTW
ncbi:hypothetical protein CEK60_20605 [Halomonas sp. N3-2A]|nr:hypothetical protein CEK60_20605 [Halomonas sp. N3-2A]